MFYSYRLSTARRLDAIEASLKDAKAERALQTQLLRQIMASLADIQTKVTNEDTVIDSAVALLQELATLVRNTAPDQAALDALAGDIDNKTAALSAALVANTPGAPTAQAAQQQATAAVQASGGSDNASGS